MDNRLAPALPSPSEPDRYPHLTKGRAVLKTMPRAAQASRALSRGALG
jgi:hypothetical protein